MLILQLYYTQKSGITHKLNRIKVAMKYAVLCNNE